MTDGYQFDVGPAIIFPLSSRRAGIVHDIGARLDRSTTVHELKSRVVSDFSKVRDYGKTP
jgi:hypothetical protein